MIRSIEGFTFASALDLNMGYYHIKLDSDVDAQKLCTIVFPCRKYKYKRLPMGINIVSILMFFQNVMSKLQDMEYVKTYLDCQYPDVFQNVMSKLVQDMEYVKTTILS
jgi:hypothetical protein